MEEYQECDVILSDVVPPQTDPDESSTECDPADPRPSLPCARAIPAADYPAAPLRDTAPRLMFSGDVFRSNRSLSG